MSFQSIIKSFLIGSLFLMPIQAFSATDNAVPKINKEAIKTYSRDFSVSEDEASRRLAIMAKSDLITQRIIEKFGEDIIAGVYFDNGSEFKVNVRTTKKGQKSRDVLDFLNKELPNLNVEVIPNSPRNFHSIENIIQNQTSVISKKVSNLQSLGYNPTTDKIAITVVDPTIKNANEFYDKYGLQKVAGMDTEIIILEKPFSTAMLMGGTSLSYRQGGGAGCTSGFSAFSGDGTMRGIITAYHCTGNETAKNLYFTDMYGTSHTLTLSPPRESSNHDMALYLADTNTPIASRIDDGTNYAQDIADRKSRTSLKVGSTYLCHSGMTTHFSCGVVSSINTSVPSREYKTDGTYKQVCKTNQSYCNNFVTITSSNLKCDGGDSGGPVFSGYTAYGIVSSCNVSEIQAGKPGRLNLSSLDYIYELPAQFAITAVPGINQ